MASVLFGLFFAHGVFAQTASLELNPAGGSYKAGETFSVKLVVKSGTTEVNAAEATVSYDTTLLSAKSVSKDGSVFTLWTKEPTISSSKGTIELGGGSPTAFSGDKTIVTIVFRAEKEGTAKVTIPSGSVVSPSQGFADILSDKTGAVFTIAAGSVTTPTTPTTPTKPKTTVGPAPDAPVVNSTTFVDPEKWYATTTGTFTWELPSDVDALKLLLDEKDASLPTVAYDPPVREKILKDLSEGESYFHIMFRNDTGWGVPTHRKIRVDITPPKTFSVTASQDDPLSQDVTLHFETTDELSGMAHYDIAVDGVSTETVEQDSLVNGAYTLSAVTSGDHTFTVTAYDSAGNTTVAETPFTVKEIVTTKAPVEEEETVEDEGFNWAYWFNLILVAVATSLIGMLMYERRTVRAEKEHIKKEADEARGKLEGIFSVLRDEMEEQVMFLSTKPNMTEAERQTLERIKEALEISEELLDKEIEDIRKLLQ